MGGNGALAFLLAAEVIAATAAVSEAALIYVARHLNLWISLGMILVQIALSFAIVLILRDELGRTLTVASGGARYRTCAIAGDRVDHEGPPAVAAAERAGIGLALAADLGRPSPRAVSAISRRACPNGSSCRWAFPRSC